MNPNSPNLFIILPAYNEVRALGQLLPDLIKALRPLGPGFTICVVDDGSTDGTSHWVRSQPRADSLQHIPHETNRGYGAAIKTGILWVVQHAQPEDVVITMDADNTHSPAYIPALLSSIQQGNDVVTASYTMPGGSSLGIPFARRVLSGGANLLLRLRCRFSNIATYTNGYRAYRVGALQQAYRRYAEHLVEETNFAGGTELFIKTVRCGARPGEIPFQLDYRKRGLESKINIPRTILGYLKLLYLN